VSRLKQNRFPPRFATLRTDVLAGTQRPLRILCARETQKSIRDSVHQLLVSQMNDLGLDAFYRVEKSRDRARGGAGIGLAIVKQLVEAGGGRVGADSADGQTRFWFSLPG